MDEITLHVETLRALAHSAGLAFDVDRDNGVTVYPGHWLYGDEAQPFVDYVREHNLAVAITVQVSEPEYD